MSTGCFQRTKLSDIHLYCTIIILLARYNEDKQAFRNNFHTSKFAQHLLEQAHSFSSINNTMQILHYRKKSARLNTVERYYIHEELAANSHLNDSQNIFPNLTLTPS